MRWIQDQGKHQPKPITVPLVRPLLSILVGVVFFSLPAFLLFFASMYWMFVAPKPNAFTTWIDSANFTEWLIAIVIIFYLIPSVLHKLLFPLIARQIAFG